jgi:hypothetical protein
VSGARFEVFTHSEAGGHRENEDAFAVRPLAGGPERYVCVVADGQGGQPGGAAAARTACETCVAQASACLPERLLLPSTWDDILRAADQAVSRDPEAGYTTAVAFCVTDAFLCGASCGDSAAVLIQGERPAAILTRGQSKNPPVGSGGAAFVPFACRLDLPWTVLAMSDGVWKYVGWERILTLKAAAPGAALVDSLLDSARLPGGKGLPDDFTLVAIQCRLT